MFGNRTLIQLNQPNDAWQPCKMLHAQATRWPKTLGSALLSRSQPTNVVLYLHKKKKKGRIAKNQMGRRAKGTRQEKIVQREREPWLIATSCSLDHLPAKRVMAIYRQRMPIEEGFRDIKCERYGLGLSSSLSTGPQRLSICCYWVHWRCLFYG